MAVGWRVWSRPEVPLEWSRPLARQRTASSTARSDERLLSWKRGSPTNAQPSTVRMHRPHVR